MFVQILLRINFVMYKKSLYKECHGTNTLAFGLIGKDGPHRIIKICFENMNLVFGSEVALLGFWEYMFQILFRVQGSVVSRFLFKDD